MQIVLYLELYVSKMFSEIFDLSTYFLSSRHTLFTVKAISVAYSSMQASCVEYITLVGDSLSSLFPHAHVNFMGWVDLSSHQLFSVTTAIMVLPTVWLRNLSLLSYLSGDAY